MSMLSEVFIYSTTTLARDYDKNIEFFNYHRNKHSLTHGKWYNF